MRNYKHCRTAAEFNAGYANSITPDVVAKWESFFRDRSAEVLASPIKRTELAYGPHPRQRLDFFPAVNAAVGRPTLIALHGGLWFLFDRWMMHFLVPAFTAAGINVVCPSYRLAPDHSLGDIVEDCRTMMRFLLYKAGSVGLNRDGMSVLGHSAAGQLAAVLASTDWATENAEPFAGLHSWIGVSGFYEIEPFALTDFHPLVRFSEADYQLWNPINLLKGGMSPALLITGREESPWLHEMCDVFEQGLRNVGTNTQVIDAAAECHFSVLSRIGEPDSDLHREVLGMLCQQG